MSYCSGFWVRLFHGINIKSDLDIDETMCKEDWVGGEEDEDPEEDHRSHRPCLRPGGQAVSGLNNLCNCKCESVA